MVNIGIRVYQYISIRNVCKVNVRMQLLCKKIYHTYDVIINNTSLRYI